MTVSESRTEHQYEFRAEIQQLLNILVHSLYTDREIFLRELISNASDALNRLQFEQLTNPQVVDPDAALEIRIKADAEARTITITDTGVGMNRAEMIENLGTIAHSGATAFMRALRERGGNAGNTNDIIGQFGVGFYSVFMVADKVVVNSRSFRADDMPASWTSDGSSAYTIADSDRTARGTEIVLHLKEDAAEFAETARLKRIVQRHSNYIAFPIHIGDEVANAQTALWRRPAREVKDDEYNAFYKQLTYDFNDPRLHLHLAADAPVQFYGLLYVPTKLDRSLLSPDYEGGVRLYARKVLIQEHSRDLLPEWMRFVQGIVDSEDLPLNISRETVQNNRIMLRLKTTLTGKMLGELEDLAKADAARYNAFWTEFGRMLKEGVVTDAGNRERLGKLLRFHSSRQPDEWVSLEDYMGRMVEGQNDIFYLFGEEVKSLLRSPHLDVFKARGIEVLLLTDPIDSFMINALQAFQEKKLHNGADADLELPAPTDQSEADQPEALPTSDLEKLIDTIGNILGERVADVRESKVLTESAVRLVAPDQGFGADMERVYRLLDEQFMLPKRVLEINPRHPLMRNLAAMGDDPLVTPLVEQIFESALLVEGIHPNPVDMIPRIQAIMEAAARRKAE